MKTLEELVKELGLNPSDYEKTYGRSGNFVVLLGKGQYITGGKQFATFAKVLGHEVIEVKPEWNTI